MCSKDPCSEDYHPAKFGDLPPPLAHGRVLALVSGDEPVDLSTYISEGGGQPPALPDVPSPAAPGDEWSQALLPPSPSSAPPPLPPPISLPPEFELPPLVGEVAPEVSGLSPPFLDRPPDHQPVGVDVSEVSASKPPPPERPPAGDVAPAVAGPPPGQPSACDGSPGVSGGGQVCRQGVELAPEVSGSGSMPALGGGVPVDGAAVVAILDRAEAVGRPRQTIGLLDLLAFSAVRRKRLILMLEEGMLDLALAMAPQVVGPDWSLEAFKIHVAVCRRHSGVWVLSGQAGATHFMAAIPTGKPGFADAKGNSAVAEGFRRGFAVAPTVADGDCGLDALNIVDGSPRSLANRQKLRFELRRHLIDVAGDPKWQAAARVLQEVDGPPEFEAGVPPGDPGPADRTAGGEPSSSNGPATDPGPIVGSASAVAEVPTPLEAAVRWATGLPHPKPDMVKRLCRHLSEQEAADILALHAEATASLAVVSKMPPKPNRVPRTLAKRYKSTYVWQRLADARAFAERAAARGTDALQKSARKLIRPFLQDHAAVKLNEKELRRGFMYVTRALELLQSETVVVPTRTASRWDRNMLVKWRLRKRRQHLQGRPLKAVTVRELLFAWLCDVKRSVAGRIPPKFVLEKAKMLMEDWVLAHVQAGSRAEASAIDHKWISRWKLSYGVSFRKPNRKWSVPRPVLMDRLCIMWGNVFRVRRLMSHALGYEPIVEGFDQSPFHMNELGSKQAGSLCIRGCGALALKEGHSASRRRWTAQTMVTSSRQRALQVPPLQIVFRAESGGAKLEESLRTYLPAWAPWMSVVCNCSGSYSEADVLNYMELVLEPMHPGRDWRILMVDAFAAQTTPAVRRMAWHKGYVLIVHGGGTTGICQVNDTDLHQFLKAGYCDLEAGEMLEQQRLVPGCCPVPRKQDCLQWMAAVWAQQALHARAVDGFWKVGIANDLGGSQDHLIVREARQFWDEMLMWEQRSRALGSVDGEWLAGRLQWDYDTIYETIIVDFPKASRRASQHPDDEGSETDSGMSDDSDDCCSDGGEDDLGGAPAVAGDPGSPSREGGGEPEAPGSPSVAPVVAGESPATSTALVNFTLDEAGAAQDQSHKLDVLRAVLEQVRQVGADRLAATVSQAIVAEERQARRRSRENPAVAMAMLEGRKEAAERSAQWRVALAMEERAEHKRRKTLKELKAESERLEQRRMALQKAATVTECLNAMKSFETQDLGQGHPQGGTAEHHRNRMQVLDRIRLRGSPLPAEQANDWRWFIKNWDQARIRSLHERVRGSWGATFKDIATDLLNRIRSGEHDALSKWMAAEGRRHLGVPALRV